MSEEEALRRLFRGILVALAVPVAGCGSTVMTSAQDAATPADVVSTPDAVVATDVIIATDVPAARDVIAVQDVPVTQDVPVLRDVVAMQDVPPAVDVPVAQDVPALVDVPAAQDVSAPQDVSPPRDVVSADAGCSVTPMIATCNERVTYSCGIAELPDGLENVSLTMDVCARVCAPAFPNGDRPFACSAYRSSPGAREVIVNCATCAIGRRTPGFIAESADCDDAVGRYFAVAAQLEAASVVAFRALAAELRAHGAPESLVRDASRSADEERRHARLTGSLARERGAAVPPVTLRAAAPRGRVELAVENAVEGCVRETFGALVAHYQRSRAADPAVRALMDVIAEDETRHAALAWSVAAWLDGVLDDGDRAVVRSARNAAVDALARELREEVPEALVREAGMPPRDVALTMLEGLREALWS